MLKFGVIAEGPTDQTVIENIIIGYFQDEEEEPVINPVQPPLPTSAAPSPPGGWTLVFKCLQQGESQKILQFNDYLVIHIDMDVQEEPGFDVPTREDGIELSPADRIARVIDRLRNDIDAAFYQTNSHRILFAVAVDSIECWLLPLLYNDNKASKTTGCLESANQALRKADENALSAGDKKFVRAYENASHGYLKRKTLLELRNKNPSLEIFVGSLDSLQSGRNANLPAESRPHQG